MNVYDQKENSSSFLWFFRTCSFHQDILDMWLCVYESTWLSILLQTSQDEGLELLMCADYFLLNKILQKKESPSWKSGSGIYQNSRLAPFCANLSRSGALYVCSLVFPWNLMHYSKFFAAIGDLERFLLLFSGRGKVGSRANCFPSLMGNCHRQACRPRNEVIFCVF